jgi:hypothetical protein
MDENEKFYARKEFKLKLLQLKGNSFEDFLLKSWNITVTNSSP